MDDGTCPRGSLPPTPKRRAFSVSDRVLYRSASSSASAARRVVSSAFSRLVRSSSSSSSRGSNDEDDQVVTTSTSLLEEPMHSASSPSSPPPTSRTRSRSDTPMLLKSSSSSWKISSKLPTVPATLKALRRPRQLSLGRFDRHSDSSALEPWRPDRVEYVTSSFSLHGEDAGAVSSYYHIVADGISAPFAGLAPECVPATRVSSAVISLALVQNVEQALENASDRNRSPLEMETFQQVVCDAVEATRRQCAVHKESRIATTLCVVYFDRWHAKLFCFTLGDSKCIVVRKGDLVFESTCTVREFNVPCVVNLTQPIESIDFLVESFELERGDICLTFTDGISDNLYKDDVLEALEALDNDSSLLQPICDALVDQCSMPTATSSASTSSPSPSVQCVTEQIREQLDSTTMVEGTTSSSSSTSSTATKPSTSSKKRFHPFATAAAYEYRRRMLRQRAVAPSEVQADRNFQRHLRDSALLLDLHDGKNVMDRQVLVCSEHRRPHYSLIQLHRMAQIRAKKFDDVTLLISRFL